MQIIRLEVQHTPLTRQQKSLGIKHFSLRDALTVLNKVTAKPKIAREETRKCKREREREREREMIE
jgi:hypothetical protein